MAAKTSAFGKMHLEEIERRAWIFHNLKQSREHARKRIIDNLRWEFQGLPTTALEKKVDEILADVYKV